MASNFPSALDNIATDKGESTVTANDHAPHHNQLAEAVNAVQSALGVNLGNVAASSALTAHTSATEAHGISAFGATLVDDANAATARTTLGLGSAATAATGDFATAAQGAKADAAIPATQKGAANGVAPLDASSKIASTYLPSFVDDVLEYANLAAFPGTGASGVIYLALDTNRVYRWSGSAYVEISASPGSTDAVPEGSINLYHTTARAAAAAPVQSVAGRTGTVTLAKGDVGLGNVDNTSDADKPVSTAQAAADTAVQSAASSDATTKANAAQAHAVQRANHTGTQTASTISDFSTAAATAAPVQSVAGRTGTVTLAKADVGLDNVDNTSDANKPVSTATQAALDVKVSSDITGITGADTVTNMVSLTQAEYDALSVKSSTTFYVIV